jgi:hypothetical protein
VSWCSGSLLSSCWRSKRTRTCHRPPPRPCQRGPHTSPSCLIRLNFAEKWKMQGAAAASAQFQLLRASSAPSSPPACRQKAPLREQSGRQNGRKRARFRRISPRCPDLPHPLLRHAHQSAGCGRAVNHRHNFGQIAPCPCHRLCKSVCNTVGLPDLSAFCERCSAKTANHLRQMC